MQTTNRNKTEKPPQSPKGEAVVDPLASLQFQSIAFQQVWQEWEQFRKEQKKTLTPTTVKKPFKLLSAHSEAYAIAMIEQSIQNGWQGLFEIKTDTNSRPLVNVMLPVATPRPTQLSDIR